MEQFAYVKKVLITEQQIIDRCEEIGKQLSDMYKDASRPVLIVGILKGSVPFMAELIKHITCDIEIDFIAASSYSGTESMGDIKIVKDLDRSVKGLDIVLVEDIVDTGLTVQKLKSLLYAKEANDVKVVSLLNKPARRIVEIEPDITGFNIENEFVIGFGLDFNQKYRNLPFIGVLKDEYYK